MKEKEKCMMCQFVIKKVNSGPYPRLSLYIYIWGPQKKRERMSGKINVLSQTNKR